MLTPRRLIALRAHWRPAANSLTRLVTAFETCARSAGSKSASVACIGSISSVSTGRPRHRSENRGSPACGIITLPTLHAVYLPYTGTLDTRLALSRYRLRTAQRNGR